MRLHLGDCRDLLASLPDDSIDAVVTDPPYGLGKPPPIADLLATWLEGEHYDAKGGGFMGRRWDAMVPGPDIWREVCRVLKPGGHLVCFAGQRTIDLMGIALRLGGLEVRESGGWCFWSGFPKSLDVSKAIDRMNGDEREVIAKARPKGSGWGVDSEVFEFGYRSDFDITAPASPESAAWNGWGTATKPAIEPYLTCRKPLRESSIARQVLATGTGAINVDGCRYPFGDAAWPGPQEGSGGWNGDAGGLNGEVYGSWSGVGGARPTDGRWPANLYACPKASRAEREAGTAALPGGQGGVPSGPAVQQAAKDPSNRVGNHHPTVKPIRLMRWLVRLVTPPGGTVLEPFCGSGTTLLAAEVEGVSCIAAEMEPAYCDIIRARFTAYHDPSDQ